MWQVHDVCTLYAAHHQQKKRCIRVTLSVIARVSPHPRAMAGPRRERTALMITVSPTPGRFNNATLFNVEIYYFITTALLSRGGSAVVSLIHP